MNNWTGTVQFSPCYNLLLHDDQEYYYDESEDDLDEVSKRPVPILLSILLVVAYIVGGAFLFQMWEGWSFLDR